MAKQSVEKMKSMLKKIKSKSKSKSNTQAKNKNQVSYASVKNRAKAAGVTNFKDMLVFAKKKGLKLQGRGAAALPNRPPMRESA